MGVGIVAPSPSASFAPPSVLLGDRDRLGRARSLPPLVLAAPRVSSPSQPMLDPVPDCPRKKAAQFVVFHVASSFAAPARRGAEPAPPAAEAAVGDWRLTDCTLYVTKEPCPMCAGAIVHCRLSRVVFGAPDPRGGAAGGAMNLLQFPTLNHACEITSGVMEADCRSLLQTFFQQKRKPTDGPDQ